MLRISKAAMALGAILALGVFSVGAAQAHTFLWTGGLSSTLLILGDGPQVFTAVPGGPSITCTHLHLEGKLAKESQLAETASGTYTGCTGPLSAEAKVSQAEYEFSADETVSVIGKPISISIPAAKCTIKVGTTKNQNLSKIRYLIDPNSGGTRLLAHVEVGSISSTIEGGSGVCGTEGAQVAGTYFGLVLAWGDAAGTLSWS